MVYVQQSEESRHQSDTGRANQWSHRCGEFSSSTRSHRRHHPYCCIPVIIPAAVLVINVVVAIQVRRAAIHSAANLGVQPHHQSSSAVPTIMLITTSLIYVLIQTIAGIIHVIWLWVYVMNSNFSITRQLSCRTEDRAMRPIYGCSEKFWESSLRTRLRFQKFVTDFCSDRY